MSWFVEDPAPTLVVAALVEAVLTVMLVKTGRGNILYAIAGVAVLAAAMLALEWWIVTDREEIQVALDGAARALEANDPQAVLTWVDPASPMRGQVVREMSGVRIERAGFRRLEVKVYRHTSPPSARADFTGFIQAKDLRGEFPYENFVQGFTVELKQHGDGWLLYSYEMHDRPNRGL
ncbi:MAG: hypothetical protein HYX69_21130 [Planctomycetia bacterium]|nr:hypothetical protein [Planctomycetia bacterium]